MSRMLRDEAEGDPVVRFGARSLYVGGETYENTAAKFWSSLIDEVLQDYRGCDVATLSSAGSVLLSGDILFPVNELQRELDKPGDISLEDAIRQAVEEISLFGPPTAVSVSLFSGKEVIKTRQLPRECADTHVFNYLVAWLLHWSLIPETKWNDELLSGKIKARDAERKLDYGMSIAFCNRHLSEGLYQRSVTVRFSRKAAGTRK